MALAAQSEIWLDGKPAEGIDGYNLDGRKSHSITWSTASGDAIQAKRITF